MSRGDGPLSPRKLADAAFEARKRNPEPRDHRPSTENASSTLPLLPPNVGYPDVVKTTPSAIAGPPASIDPPCAVTVLTVWKSRAVSKSQTMRPSSVEKAQMPVDGAREDDAGHRRDRGGLCRAARGPIAGRRRRVPDLRAIGEPEREHHATHGRIEHGLPESRPRRRQRL